MKQGLALAFCLFLTSCQGYILHENSKTAAVEVPFIAQDEEGLITQEVILALERAGFSVARYGRYELKINLQSQSSRALGYAYIYDDKGAITTALGPNEERINSRYTVSLIDKHSEEVIAGPDVLEVSIDYDQEVDEVPYSSVQDSLGQLNIGPEAKASAQAALGRRLAKEIAIWMHAAYSKRLSVR